MLDFDKKYKNWFVIQVKTLREYFIRDFVEKHTDEKIKMLIFSKEVIFERGSKVFKGLNPIFPGYIFVHKKADRVIALVKKYLMSEFIQPICFKAKESRCKLCFKDTSPCMVNSNEMKFFLDAADDSGVIGLSYYIQNNEKLKIVNGPLKYLDNKIVWINKKKKRVCVEVELLKRKMTISLGFEMIN